MGNFKPKLFSVLKTYSLAQLSKDVTAGIIVAIIALPLSIALAISSGVSPERGLYTAIVAGFIISMLGGSRVQIGGPTGAFMVIVYGVVANFGYEGLVITTFLAGIMMILFGVFKLGNIIKFIPYPITTGFTSGIALVIFSAQIKDLLGLRIESVPAEFIGKWSSYYFALDTINPNSVIVGAISLLILIFWPKINRKIPAAFISLVVASALVKLLGIDVPTIGSKFGEISSSLPRPIIPHITVSNISLLIGPAFTIAILGSIESLLSAVVSDGMIGGKHRSNTELIAQGIANMASSMFGGIPATGAIARTVANVKNGGRTPIAGMVHSVTLLLIMMIFMPLAKMIPLASLSAVLIIVAYNMSGWREFKALLKSPKSDVIILLATFLITVLIDLVKAIEIGIILASFLFMKRMSDVSNVNITSLDAAEDTDDYYDFINENEKLQTPEDVQIYEINGPFFFGAAEKFIQATGELGKKTHTLIIRMRNVPAMDATGLQAFKNLIELCKHKDVQIVISGITPQPLKVLKNTGVYDLIGADNFVKTVEEAKVISV